MKKKNTQDLNLTFWPYTLKVILEVYADVN